MEKDYLDELIEESCKDPSFAAKWAEEEVRIELAMMRQRAGLTQKQVADKLGLPQPRIAEIERHPGRVSLSRLQKYMKAIGGEISFGPASNRAAG
ncbi:MAG: helix-turn-helix domain-containing protein [Fimbriimonas sp.]